MPNALAANQNFMNPSTFSWRGRIGRQRFLATLLIANFGGGLLGALLLEAGDAGALLAIVLSVFMLLATVFAYMKRCRDAGISPWWTLVVVIPLASLILFIVLLWRGSEPLPDQSAPGTPRP